MNQVLVSERAIKMAMVAGVAACAALLAGCASLVHGSVSDEHEALTMTASHLPGVNPRGIKLTDFQTAGVVGNAKWNITIRGAFYKCELFQRDLLECYDAATGRTPPGWR
jgi:hypothetical protein